MNLTLTDKINSDNLEILSESYNNMSLQGLRIGTSRISKCTFISVDMSDSSFVNCVFTSCSFTGVDMSKALFKNCTFSNCKFEVSSLMQMVIKETAFTNCVFIDIRFDSTQLGKNTAFNQCSLSVVGLRDLQASHPVDMSGSSLESIVGFEFMKNFKLTPNQIISISNDMAESYGIIVQP